MSLPVWLKSMFQPRRRPLRRNPPLSSLRLRWRCRLFLEPLEDRFVPATIGNEIFLQGDFIEVGIHSAGSFGTNANAPAGFHPTNGGLGFVVDPGKDGWTVGTPPKSGDFFMPGTPEEGWTVEWNSANGTERNFSNYGRVSGTAVTPTRVQETSSGDTRSAVWEGTATSGSDSLKITQTVHFKKSDQFFVISVTLTNTGTTTLNNVQYMRNVDPDQEQPLTGNFTTDNYVVYQPPHPGVTAGTSGNTNKALVVGRGLNFGIPLGLGAIDPRATVSTEGFSNRDPDAIINSPVAPSINSPIRADQAIVIAFDLGTLAPGQSVTFDYVYILNQADLENALGQLAAVTILQPTGTVSGNSVVFQATTDDVSHTSKIEFFAGNTKVGEDATEDAGGVYSTSFSSLAYSNGALELKAIATFDDGRIVEKTATVTVTNDGPPIALSTPSSGQFFSGSNIPIAVQILDANHAPTQVSFFRESGGTSTTLAVDTSAPFSTTFSVDDLDPGANVVIKAVARDSLGRTTTVQVAGSVASNLPPVANPQNVATQEDQSVTIQLTGDDGDDGENQTLTYQITQQPQNGTIQDFDPATGSLTYNPGQNFTGEDAIGFTVSDNGTPGPLTSPEATVTITVNPVNDGPQAENASFVLAENSPTGKVLGLVSATDVDSETLNYAIIAGNTGEAFEIDGSSGQITVANGAALDFEANPHFSLTVEVSDGESSEQAVVTVDLTNVNEGPQFQGNPLQVTTGENRSQLVQLQTPQVDSPNEEGEEVSVESFQITQLPEHGKLLAGETELQVGDLVTDDSIIYVPDPNYSGQDSFNYGAVDSDGNSTTASQEVAIAIGAGVHLLINQGEPLQGLEGQPIRVPFQTDEAGPGLDAVVRVTVSGLPSNARFVRVDANGNVVNETDPSLGTRNEEGDWVFDDGLASGLYVVVPNVVGTQEFHLQVTTESADRKNLPGSFLKKGTGTGRC
jgi:hypothetical protein